MEVQMPEESNGDEPAQAENWRGRRIQWLIGMGLEILAWGLFISNMMMTGGIRLDSVGGGFIEGSFILGGALVIFIALAFTGLVRVIFGFLAALILVPLLLFGLCFVAIPFL